MNVKARWIWKCKYFRSFEYWVFLKYIFCSNLKNYARELENSIEFCSNLVVNSMQREGAARQNSKVFSWPNSVLVAPLWVALQSYSVAPLGVARPKGAATPPSEKMQSLLGLGTQWRDSGHLSRQWCWRDKPTLSAQRLRALVPAQRLFWHWPVGPGGQPLFRV